MKNIAAQRVEVVCKFLPCHRFGVLVLATIFILLEITSPVSGAPGENLAAAETVSGKASAMDTFKAGVDALEKKDFDEAAGLFKKVSVIEPRNLEYQYYLGVAYVRLNKNREAMAIFESLTAEDPELFFKAYFDIAAIYSSEKNYVKAIETLEKAKQIHPGSGRVFLDMGYACKDSGNFSRAMQCFGRARTLDPGLNQISVYMIGVTCLEQEQFNQAVQKLKEAVSIDPETALAKSARQIITRAEKAAWNRKPWYMRASFNWGYDDNVPLDPLDEISGGTITGGKGKADQYQTFLLKGGYKFLNRKKMEAGVGYALLSVGYEDWADSNVTSHTPHAYFKADRDPVFFRLEYDLSYFYSGGEKQGINPPFYLTFGDDSRSSLRMHSFMPVISIREPYNLRSDITLIYQIKDYMDGLNGDSSHYYADITQSYQIPQTQIFPRIGYRMAYEQSDDESSTYNSHELTAGVASHFCWGIWGDLSFSGMETHYPDFSPGRGRRDRTYITTFSLRRNMLEHFLLSFSYIHIKNDSGYRVNGENHHSFLKNVFTFGLTYVC